LRQNSSLHIPHLPHKEVRLPIFINAAYELTEERDMVRTDGPSHEGHLCFVRCLASLHIVTAQTRADQVLPRVLATTTLRHNVINRERDAHQSAILASVSIAAQNVLARENDFFKRNADVGRKPDHARKWHRHRSRVNGAAMQRAHELSLLKIQQDDRLLNTCNGKWLVIAV